jgi:hypothetical protein
MIGTSVLVFFAGLLEDYIGAWRTQSIAGGKRLYSFLAGIVYTLVYVLLLSKIVEATVIQHNGLVVVASYALGSGVGGYLLVRMAKR